MDWTVSVQNRPLTPNHSKQTTFITDSFITDHFITVCRVVFAIAKEKKPQRLQLVGDSSNRKLWIQSKKEQKNLKKIYLSNHTVIVV